MSGPEFQGGCLCGAIRYRASGAPVRGVMCHCSMCRRHSGAPALAFVHFPADAFQWTRGSVSWFASSPKAARGFCEVCGSTIGMREDALSDRVQICVGTLDDPDAVRLDDHVWTVEKIEWFDVKDDLPRFERSSTAVASDALQD